MIYITDIYAKAYDFVRRTKGDFVIVYANGQFGVAHRIYARVNRLEVIDDV